MAARIEDVAMVDYLNVPGGRLYYEVSGAGPMVFPGDHVGMATHPRAFVERQDGVFQSS